MRGMRGAVTLYISMVMLCVFALFCGLLESARTAGARWYLRTASSSALDSVFAQYHRELWDSYRLLFAEYDGEEELQADFAGFLQPYLTVGNWYPMELSSLTTEEMRTAVDDCGAYLEQEILDYMKYGVWDLDFDVGTAEEIRKSSQEAGAVKQIAQRYRAHAGEALKLEKALEAVSACGQRQGQLRDSAMGKLQSYDGAGFRREAKELLKELGRMPGLVAEYERQADRLKERLEDSRNHYNEEKGACGDAVQSQLEQEIRQYESYVAEDGERRGEVVALAAHAEAQAALVQAAVDAAERVEEIIDEWDGDEEDEEPDLETLWLPVIRSFARVEIRTVSFRHGVKDKEKEGWLKQAEKLCQSGLLSLAVPEGMTVSAGAVDTAEFPSHSEIVADGARATTLLNHLLVNEYCGNFFRCAQNGGDGAAGDSVTGDDGVPVDAGKSRKDAGGAAELSYEVEYLLGGAASDEENLAATVSRLLAVREGLNLIHLLSDAGKREQARTLAMAVTGVAGLSPLVHLTTFLILSVWALGESLMDVRGLLAGERVPFVKSAADWTLDLDGLLALGRDGQTMTGGCGHGLSYVSWLKLLLFADDIVRQEYRMMDMMQMNLRRKQNSFRMRRCVYQVQLKGQVQARHVFYSPGFMQSFLGGNEHGYGMAFLTERAY